MTKPLPGKLGPAERKALQVIIDHGHAFTHSNGRYGNHDNSPRSIHQVTVSRLEKRGLVDYGFRVDPERWSRPGMPLVVVLTEVGKRYVATLGTGDVDCPACSPDAHAACKPTRRNHTYCAKHKEA